MAQKIRESPSPNQIEEIPRPASPAPTSAADRGFFVDAIIQPAEDAEEADFSPGHAGR